MARNKELSKQFKGQPCHICGQPGVGHHLKHYAGDSRKDILENIIALCNSHHNDAHTMGLTTFVNNFNLHDEMEKRGFEYDEAYGGWLRQF